LKRVLLLLCDGVELFEAAAFHDVLGWATEYGSEPIEVVTLGAQREVACTFGLTVAADRVFGEVLADDFDALALPGGFVEYGFDDCALAEPVAALIRRFAELGRPIAAICTGAVAVAAGTSRSGPSAPSAARPARSSASSTFLRTTCAVSRASAACAGLQSLLRTTLWPRPTSACS